MIIKKITNQGQAQQAIKLINKFSNLPKLVRVKDILDKNHYYLGVFENNCLLGCVGIWENSFYSSEIRYLVVDPKFRTKGLGIKLVIQ